LKICFSFDTIYKNKSNGGIIVSALDVLQERGYIQQMTHEEEIREL